MNASTPQSISRMARAGYVRQRGYLISLIAYGGYQLLRAWRGSFRKELHLSRLTSGQRVWTERVCACGIAARGLVFCIIGAFVSRAGWESDPSEARGIAGALNALPGQPYGPWLLAFVALGLVAYGIYCCVKARYGQLRANYGAHSCQGASR